MGKGQVSVENMLLVGIIISLLSVSLYAYGSSMDRQEEQSREIYAAGVSIVDTINNFQNIDAGSAWMTVTVKYGGPKGALQVQNKNELILTDAKGIGTPFFVGSADKVLVSDGLTLKPGTNRLKLASKDGIVCISDLDDTCDYEEYSCEDRDEDTYDTCGSDADCKDIPGEGNDINPGQLEVCNRIDDNCDGQIDEKWDADGDDFPDKFASACAGLGDQLDCDDADPEINPGAAEVCDGIDNDCDEVADDFEHPTCGVMLGLLGFCADFSASCIHGDDWQWTCPSTGPEGSATPTTCTNGVDDDCDNYIDMLDSDCSGLIFFADYDHIPDGGPDDWLDADVVLDGDPGPVVASLVTGAVGVNDTGVNFSRTSGTLKYEGYQNIDFNGGTIQFWVKSTGPDNMWADDEQHTFFSASSQTEGRLEIYKNNENKLAMDTSAGADLVHIIFPEPVSSYLSDQWYFITVTWNSVPSAPFKIYLYVNGEKWDEQGSGTAHWPIPATDRKISIGSRDRGGFNDAFAGAAIDHVEIFNDRHYLDRINEDYSRFTCDYDVATDPCASGGGVGDVSGDGCRSEIDTSLLKQYLDPESGYDPEENIIACMDMNQDCHITQADLEMLQPGKYENCALGIDDDCDGEVDNNDPDCHLLFLADYNEEAIPAQFFNADICAGSCVPGLNREGVETSGNEGTAAAWTGEDPVMSYSAVGNVNLDYGTIEFWIKPENHDWNFWNEVGTSMLVEMEKDDSNANKIVLTKSKPSEASLPSLDLIVIGADGIAKSKSSTMFPPDFDGLKWHHIAVTWRPTDNKHYFFVYLDGKTVISFEVADSFMPAVLNKFSVSMAESGGAGSLWTNAALDNVKIFSENKISSEASLAYKEFQINLVRDGIPTCTSVLGDIDGKGCFDGEDKRVFDAFISNPWYVFPLPLRKNLACLDFNHDGWVNKIDHTIMKRNPVQMCNDCITPISSCKALPAHDYCTSAGLFILDCTKCGYECSDPTPACCWGSCAPICGSSPIFDKRPIYDI
jgi:hypothetical protein